MSKKVDRGEFNLKQILNNLNSINFYLLLFFLVIYYRFSKSFVYESLLHLTPGRLEKLDFLPVHVSPTGLDSLTVYVTLFICAIIFAFFYNFSKGNLNQSTYDFRVQIFALVCLSLIHI